MIETGSSPAEHARQVIDKGVVRKAWEELTSKVFGLQSSLEWLEPKLTENEIKDVSPTTVGKVIEVLTNYLNNEEYFLENMASSPDFFSPHNINGLNAALYFLEQYLLIYPQAFSAESREKLNKNLDRYNWNSWLFHLEKVGVDGVIKLGQVGDEGAIIKIVERIAAAVEQRLQDSQTASLAQVRDEFQLDRGFLLFDKYQSEIFVSSSFLEALSHLKRVANGLVQKPQQESTRIFNVLLSSRDTQDIQRLQLEDVQYLYLFKAALHYCKKMIEANQLLFDMTTDVLVHGRSPEVLKNFEQLLEKERSRIIERELAELSATLDMAQNKEAFERIWQTETTAFLLQLRNYSYTEVDTFVRTFLMARTKHSGS